jgi:hypothetical protein
MLTRILTRKRLISAIMLLLILAIPSALFVFYNAGKEQGAEDEIETQTVNSMDEVSSAQELESSKAEDIGSNTNSGLVDNEKVAEVQSNSLGDEAETDSSESVVNVENDGIIFLIFDYSLSSTQDAEDIIKNHGCQVYKPLSTSGPPFTYLVSIPEGTFEAGLIEEFRAEPLVIGAGFNEPTVPHEPSEPEFQKGILEVVFYGELTRGQVQSIADKHGYSIETFQIDSSKEVTITIMRLPKEVDLDKAITELMKEPLVKTAKKLGSRYLR